ncbi:hypothetical protein [Streptomyces sp. NPDC091212]|uniref:hypothetical protein n=1 Tax=Streptomyces sp. NPDC091212 TaxID=3155191 RepID=UPI0034415E33
MATQTATDPPATETRGPSRTANVATPTPPTWTLPAWVPPAHRFGEPTVELMVRVRLGLRRWAA